MTIVELLRLALIESLTPQGARDTEPLLGALTNPHYDAVINDMLLRDCLIGYLNECGHDID